MDKERIIYYDKIKKDSLKDVIYTRENDDYFTEQGTPLCKCWSVWSKKAIVSENIIFKINTYD